MARVLPSDVVRLIQDHFPWVIGGKSPPGVTYALGPSLAGVIDVAQQIPESLLPFSGAQRAAFLFSISSVRHLAERVNRGVSSAGSAWPWPEVDQTNVVMRLWQLLHDCPDEAIAESSAGLEFIADAELKRGLRIDLSSVENALNNGEWKAATVLAGSVLEAILLSGLRTCVTDAIAGAAERAHNNGKLTRTPDERHLERWDLSELIEVAAELKIITEGTSSQARLAKNFRNLIHPGRELRLQIRCDRATARTAAAAVDHAIRDLSERSR